MQAHKERIAQLREMRAAVSKPVSAVPSFKNTATSTAQPISKDVRKRDVPASKESARPRPLETAPHNPKPSSVPSSSSSSSSSFDNRALSLLHEERSKDSPSSSHTKGHADRANHTEESIHRRLQATVLLLSESLEEQGHLKALLELTSRPRMFDSLLQHLAHPPESLLHDVKMRALRQEKEKLLSQMIDMRTLLEEERTRCQTMETELRVTREMLQSCQEDLERSENEVDKLRNRLSATATAGTSSRRPPGTPPAHLPRSGMALRTPFSPPPSSSSALPQARKARQEEEEEASPDISLGCAEDYPLPPDEEEGEEEDREREEREEDDDESLAFLDLDADPPSHGFREEMDRPPVPVEEQQPSQPEEDSDRRAPSRSTGSRTAPRTSSRSTSPSPAEEDVCVVLDIDLGENARDQVVIRPLDNPAQLAFAFMQKHRLGDALFGPLCEYILTTQRELVASLSIAEGLDASQGGRGGGGGASQRREEEEEEEDRHAPHAPSMPPLPEEEEGEEEEEEQEEQQERAEVIAFHDSDLEAPAEEEEEEEDDRSASLSHGSRERGRRSPLPTRSPASPASSTSSSSSSSSAPSKGRRLSEDFGEAVEEEAAPPTLPPGSRRRASVAATSAETSKPAIRSRRASLPPPPPAAASVPASSPLRVDVAMAFASPSPRRTPGTGMRSVSSPLAPHHRFSFPEDKSLAPDDVEQVVAVAAEVMQRAQALQREGRNHLALPLYENAIRLFELADCSEVDAVRDLLAEDLL